MELFPALAIENLPWSIDNTVTTLRLRCLSSFDFTHNCKKKLIYLITNCKFKTFDVFNSCSIRGIIINKFYFSLTCSACMDEFTSLLKICFILFFRDQENNLSRKDRNIFVQSKPSLILIHLLRFIINLLILIIYHQNI